MPETLEETKQNQPVETGIDKEVKETSAGELKVAEDTASTKEESGDSFSIENIGAKGKVETTEDVLKVDGISEHAQKSINNKIGNAIKDRNIAQEATKKANAKIVELETAQAVPKDRPLAPLERNFDDDTLYQDAMSKYQTETITYNNIVTRAQTQEKSAVERVKVNDNRLIGQMAELQEKFPDLNIKETIGNIADNDGFGNAAAFIADSEHSGRIALFLAKNEPQRLRIAGLTDIGSINREIGKLEQQLSNVQKTTTTASGALNTISNNTETGSRGIYDIKDGSEFLKARNREIREKQGIK